MDPQSLPTQQIRDKMDPVNDFLVSNLHLIVIVFAIIMALYFLQKLRAYIFYRIYKGKNEVTNEWFDWGAYYEYFDTYQKRKRREESEKILARQDRRARNRYLRKTDQNNG